MPEVENYLTIDYEEWYQGLTSTSARQNMWPEYEDRLVQQTKWLLDALRANNARATFFIIGQTARDNPDLIKQIANEGHEIGLHGDLHQKVREMTRAQFHADLDENYKAVVTACGVPPVGYRAAYAAISKDMDWLWEELGAKGLKYDASVYPFKTPLYGMPDAPRDPYVVETPHGKIAEFPLSTVRLLGMNLPFSGGFYFRVLPYLISSAITRAKNKKRAPVIFYFHPWEFDPGHPIPACVTPRERLSHYGFLRNNEKKFLRLLKDFKFQPLGNALSATK